VQRSRCCLITYYGGRSDLARDRADALLVALDSFFAGRRVQFATTAARYGIPTAYFNRVFVEVSGLMTYGTDVAESVRLVASMPAAFSRRRRRPIYRSSSPPSSSSPSTYTPPNCSVRHATIAARHRRRADRMKRRDFITLSAAGREPGRFWPRGRRCCRCYRLAARTIDLLVDGTPVPLLRDEPMPGVDAAVVRVPGV
jgi:hypothetical protein